MYRIVFRGYQFYENAMITIRMAYGQNVIGNNNGRKNYTVRKKTNNILFV